jgi:hypothetical protein
VIPIPYITLYVIRHTAIILLTPLWSIHPCGRNRREFLSIFK